MAKLKNQKVYRFYSADGELLHCGRTKRELHKREGEHRRRFGEPDGYAVLVDDGLTMTEASNWEKENRCSPFNRDGDCQEGCDIDDICIDDGDDEEDEYDAAEEYEDEDDDSLLGAVVGGLAAVGAVVGIGFLIAKAFESDRNH